MVTVNEESWDTPVGAQLRAAQRAELDARYGNSNHEPGSAPSADDIAVFVVARDENAVGIGCGALRLLGDGSAEIKRMYVIPFERGGGAAVAILRELERLARDRGIEVLKLETGSGQPDAVRFYEREGYSRIDSYGPYVDEPTSLCFARSL
ncbi:GNAT family N-acetyltransferase [Rhodococcus sp. BP-252]|uniref:GCN5 family acetyltransferase n=1 Tax=Rhodococcoides kyotonense TaxID=398843 RepID=A0A177YFV5_9NOCA|nr:GNAT family N-acetyltransferase [Rhodococcus sp. B10]MBY6413116.1 GNAT family N-acetyltransferase [Rhodococcus sp. BP-320]MBY6417721.1 GNAT family N-acetyltransferase [Rhodococcus sp. BP-321]MBY6423255.1 GNAT family N-acetyltransferase [Rhodococcus sp. BP-324]MBY6427858.1 GNAT family N-acetyltransferase [Rhodococcus sp. BP-323]MBY6431857.1 GNAT family N-acetyltransferase [Rhodococcus sp. BP-322]MBY6441965.1 GNAT family N-acetyltransferase [Rhodococcus sp. BP-319]MBY6446833.1 GNAT family N